MVEIALTDVSSDQLLPGYVAINMSQKFWTYSNA